MDVVADPSATAVDLGLDTLGSAPAVVVVVVVGAAGNIGLVVVVVGAAGSLGFVG